MALSRYIDGSRVVYWNDSNGNLTVPGTLTASNIVGASIGLGSSIQISSIQCSSIGAGSIINGSNTSFLTYTNSNAPASDGTVNNINITALNQRVRPSLGEQLLFTSSMGAGWTQRTAAANYGWRRVAWSPTLKLYCAVCATTNRLDNIMTSPDGITWTLRTTPNALSFSGIIWADTLGKFVAIGGNASSESWSAVSADGISWNTYLLPTYGFWNELSWSPQLSRMVAVSWRASERSVAYSSDGQTWITLFPNVPSSTNRWYGICWSAEVGLFVAVGPFADADSGVSRFVMTSPDGITWTQRAAPASKDWYSVAWSPELKLFAAVSRTGDTQGVMTSPNGVTWTLRSTPAHKFTYITWIPELSMFAVLNETNASITVSRDGVTWIAYPVFASAQKYYGMAWSREQSKLVITVDDTVAPGIIVTSEVALPASQNTLLFTSPGYASVNNSTGLISMSSMNISSATVGVLSGATLISTSIGNVGNINITQANVSTLSTNLISSAITNASTINVNTISSAVTNTSTMNVNTISSAVVNVSTINTQNVSSAIVGTSTINANTISSGIGRISTINTQNISSAIVTTSTITLNNTRTILGSNAGATNPGDNIVAVGYLAGQSNQGSQAIAVGYTAGKISQNGNSVAIGYEAGFSNQGAGGIAIGVDAGYENQGIDSVSIGTSAGYTSQGSNTVAIGFNAAGDTQGIFAVAIGYDSGFISQGSNAVSLGYYAGRQNQGVNAISIGASAGKVNQATNAVAIGYDAGKSNQNPGTVAVGVASGYYNQASNAIAVGGLAGYSNQASNAVAIGNYAGYQSQGIQAVAIGSNAGRTNQGSNAIAIGNGAGETNQVANSIILNASNVALNAATNAGFYVNPVRNVATTNVVYYDTTTKEVTYAPPVSSFNSFSTGTASIGALNVSSLGGFSPIQVHDALILNSTLIVSTIVTPFYTIGEDGTSKCDTLIASTITTSSILGFSPRSATTGDVIYFNSGTKELTYGAAPSGGGTVSTFDSLSSGTASIGALNVSSLGGFSPIRIMDALLTTSSIGIGTTNPRFPLHISTTLINSGINIDNPVNPTLRLNTFYSSNARIGYISMKSGQFDKALQFWNDSTDLSADNDVLYKWIGPFTDPIMSLQYNGAIQLNRSRTIIGSNAGAINPGTGVVAVGQLAGNSNQGIDSVAVGQSAGYISQGSNSVAIGPQAGTSNQGAGAISIGKDAGSNSQGLSAIAIGSNAGSNSQSQSAIALGTSAGSATQGINAVAIGINAGNSSQGASCIAIGQNAGEISQTTMAIAIGIGAGNSNQGSNGIAIGQSAGEASQSFGAIAIGYLAGFLNQGENSIAIGNYAGTSQFSNSIILNATGGVLTNTQSGLFIAPIRSVVSGSNVLTYDPITKEIKYNTAKTFVIDHPHDSSRLLVHGCLEGPEAGVYYRGTSCIPNNSSSVVVRIPAYATAFRDFTIQVTPIWNGVAVRTLNVSRMSAEGTFSVHGEPGEFDWLVHGLRADIEVEPRRTDVDVRGDGPYRWIAPPASAPV